MIQGVTTPTKLKAINFQLEQKTKELEKIIEYRTRGAILRAKCRWYNEGEKIRSIFLVLKKDTTKMA